SVSAPDAPSVTVCPAALLNVDPFNVSPAAPLSTTPPLASKMPPPLKLPAVQVNSPVVLKVDPAEADSIPESANAPTVVKLRPPASEKAPLLLASPLKAANVELAPLKPTLPALVVMPPKPLPARVALAKIFHVPPVR